jgi:hypothetical protein
VRRGTVAGGREKKEKKKKRKLESRRVEVIQVKT